MQTTLGVNTDAMVDGVPRTLALREVIPHYVQPQREVVVRRAKRVGAHAVRTNSRVVRLAKRGCRG